MNSSVLRMLGVLLLGVALGWYTGRAPLQTKLAEQEATTAKEHFRTAQRTAEVLKDAQDRGDVLSAALLANQTEVDQLKRKKHDAVAKVTTGRPCLYGPALRLLSSAPGLSVNGLTPAPSSAAAEGQAATADTDNQGDQNTIVSTDADLTSWAIDAGAQYKVCRTRLDALIDWHTP